MPYGIQSMLKEGHQHMSGLEEAVLKNIEAVKALSNITRTSLGPNGMNKMVINHLEKLLVTSDAATIVQELEIQHPAAKLVVMAAQAQESEIGDGTNLVVALAGELLSHAEDLLRDGLHTAEVAEGYAKAGKKALEILEELVLPGSEKMDVFNPTDVANRIKGSVGSKQYGYEDVLAPLIAQACISVCPQNAHNFNVDNVRVAKIPGGGLHDSSVINGLVIRRDTEGSVKNLKDCKVVVYAQGVDTSATETKGTVLLKTAAELESYSRGEEEKMEAIIKGISESGVKMIISGSAIGELAMHYIERNGMMAVKIPSKFELRRVCRATGATALIKFEAPKPEELGFAAGVDVQEIGGTRCIVLKQDSSRGKIATVVLRASTENVLDDVERAVDDGVNAFKALGRDPRTVAAGGASEIEIAHRLAAFGRKETGLEQYAINKFAESLEVVPRTLAENAGQNATDVVSQLYAAHAAGDTNAAVDIEEGGVCDLTKVSILDVYTTKWWAIKLAADAVNTVLRVDQIIMAKQAGGPKPKGPGGDED